MTTKKALFAALFSMASSTLVFGQEKKELDKNSIKDLCGCYEITFKYTETFAPEIDYEKKLDYTAAALELALPIYEGDDKISIQHLLVVNDTMVVKHWRQDWIYENEEVFTYNKDNSWNFKKIPADQVSGQWTQKVYQTDDSPRYSGSATWVHFDGKHFWENKADSPLPRREYTKRSDYNVMIRGNRHEITDFGWVHEQDNDKIIRTEGAADVLLAQEKGMNIYTKVAEEKCQLAKDWWDEHGDFWTSVREAWNGIYDREGDLTLAKKVDGKPLFMHLYPLEKKGATSDEIEEVISKFVIAEKEVSSVQTK
ncbi:DUF6607 family protein [Robiginitalea sp. IMCC43444]|uniref:DUF6607 family protein n=1 Tax=Robiginitalea sp. IMCC43444 TaxID=3459121 RepID=UPI0040414328